MKLLIENIDSTQFITEETGGAKHHFIQGIFLQAGIKNRNGRIYPPPVMESAVNRYIAEKVNTGSAYGELDHPNGPKINLERASHIIKELHREGNNWIGKAQLIDEGMGRIAIGLAEAGANLGVSSRALGSVKQKNGLMEVQPDFRLFSVDIVGTPSAPKAYVESLMESADWVYDNGVISVKTADDQRHKIDEAARAHRTGAAILEAWESLVQAMENYDVR